MERRPPPRPHPGGDHIRLVLPAEPDYGRIARVAASSLALRLGLTFVEIEDLRIAVDEAVILLLRPEGTDGSIALELTVLPDRLEITAAVPGSTVPIEPSALRRFEEIVADTVDGYDVDPDTGRVHLVKRY